MEKELRSVKQKARKAALSKDDALEGNSAQRNSLAPIRSAATRAEKGLKNQKQGGRKQRKILSIGGLTTRANREQLE